MLRTDLTDHRNTDQARLVHAIADGDAIALAEAYHRTVTAAHACARRLLASPVEIEALLRSVYSELWEEPPVDEALEGWLRARCFALGTGYLRQRGLSAPSASLATWTNGVTAEQRAGQDPLERMIAELTDEQQAALVRAHDQGLRTSRQDDPDAGDALLHALLVLASPLTDDERHAAEMCSSGVALANWMFGLLPPHEAATVPGTSAEPTPCGRLAGVLRRARRRFEPLPPTPDLGHRVLAWVLGGAGARQTHEMRASSLDTDLRVASADLDRGPRTRRDAPRSTLDMTVPALAPAEAAPQPVTALRRDTAPPPAWGRPESGQSPGDDRRRPLGAASGPPGRAAAGAAPVAFGNAAPALREAPAGPDDEVSEDLVRMPLQGRRPAPVTPPTGQGDDTVPPRTRSAPPEARPSSATGGDVTQPPVALRKPGGPTDAPSDRGEAPETPHGHPTGAPAGSDSDNGPAPSPLPQSDTPTSTSSRDFTADSPLRRPTSPSRGTPPGPSEGDTAPPPLGIRPPARDQHESGAHSRPATREEDRGPEGADPRRGPAAQPEQRPGADEVAETIQTPVQRDDSDPRFDDLFGGGGPANTASGRPARPPPGEAANMTAPTLPPARRPTRPPSSATRPPSATMRPQGRPATAGASPDAGSQTPAAESGTRSGGSVLRWIVVLLLVVAGAAVGIFLGQAIIG